MVYNNNIPLGTDRPKNSAGQIRENFSQLDSQYGSSGDHVAFSAASLNGTHNKVRINEGSDPNPAANQIALYCKDVSSVSELFFQRESAGSVIQMSNGAAGPGTSGGASGFQTFLPGGLKIKMGLGVAVAGVVSFANVGITPFTTCYGVIVTGSSASAPNVTSISPTTFTLSPAGSYSVYFIAWGI